MLFHEKLYNMFELLILKYELPDKCLVIQKNFSKTGKETSESICINEPGFPDASNVTNNTLVLNLKEASGFVKLTIRPFMYKSVLLASDADVIKQHSNKSYHYFTFSDSSTDLLKYIESCIVYSIENYSPSYTFGCCSKYIECSNAKVCLHENKLYSKGCMYLDNLINERIFYGDHKTTC